MFGEPDLITDAGLVAALALAERIGLSEPGSTAGIVIAGVS